MTPKLREEKLTTKRLLAIFGIKPVAITPVRGGWMLAPSSTNGGYATYDKRGARRGFEWKGCFPHEWNQATTTEQKRAIHAIAVQQLIEANPDKADEMACRL